MPDTLLELLTAIITVLIVLLMLLALAPVLFWSIMITAAVVTTAWYRRRGDGADANPDGQ